MLQAIRPTLKKEEENRHRYTLLFVASCCSLSSLISLSGAIGSPVYNVLLDLMKCQVKHPNQSVTREKGCKKVEKDYSKCHSAIMGVGNYSGRKNCSDELIDLFKCVNPDVEL